MEVDAFDDEPLDVLRVEVLQDERFVEEAGALPYRWRWDVSGYAPGAYEVEVVVYLTDGRQVEARWTFVVGGAADGDFAPAAYATWLDIPPDATSALRAGCQVNGANAGSGLGSLTGLFGAGYASTVLPDEDGRIPHLLLAHVADWPQGAPVEALHLIDLRLLDGVHEPPAMWVARSSFPDGDPSRPPRVRYTDTRVAGGTFRTPAIERGIGLPPILGWRPLVLAGASVRGQLWQGMSGFGVTEGHLEGYWTEAEILAAIVDLQAACVADDAPDECAFWAGVVPPGSDPREVLELILGLVGGYDARWDGTPHACDPGRPGDCNAVSVCVLFEMGEAVIEGVLP
jgi:hypothetical protein